MVDAVTYWTITLIHALNQETGLSLSMFSITLSVGLLSVAVGKVVNGYWADKYGGMLMFSAYLVGSALSTIAMALSPKVSSAGSELVLTFWIVVWCINRWFTSGAWGAMILFLSIDVPQHCYGMCLSIIAVGYSLGDVIARFVRSIQWINV